MSKLHTQVIQQLLAAEELKIGKAIVVVTLVKEVSVVPGKLTELFLYSYKFNIHMKYSSCILHPQLFNN